MYRTSNTQSEKVESSTFASLGLKEEDIEELLRQNIDMICDDEESMLIVGKQVRNQSSGISDLTAVDSQGNLVLIEIKRDRKDIESRRESFEFQAIRYAASYATIKNPEDLINRVYAPYLEKYEAERSNSSLTSTELANRELYQFLSDNNAEHTFNEAQRIILVASDYDEQTLSAVSWLSDNSVGISCYKLVPYMISEELYIAVEKVLPLLKNEDYYIEISAQAPKEFSKKLKGHRRNLPKIDALLEWGVVKPGDTLIAKGRGNRATLKSNGKVEVYGEEHTMQKWLQNIFGWSSVQTYVFAIHQRTGKSLSQLRAEYMNKEV